MRSLAPLACGLLLLSGAGRAAEPPPLGRPVASLAAAPAWWERPALALGGPSQAYAPGSPDAPALYRAASAEAVEAAVLEGGALACSVSLGEHHFDGLAPFASEETLLGDIAAVAGVGAERRKAPALVTVTQGREDTNQVEFLVPLVRLRVGDTLWIHLVDMDVSLHDDVETLRVRYAGKLPLALKGRFARGDCRPVTRQALEAALTRRLARLDEALEAALARGARPDFLESVVTGVDGFLAGAREAALRAAALVGWSDPRVTLRVVRLAELDALATRVYAEAFEQLRANAVGPGWTPVPASQLEVRVERLACGRGALGPARALVAFPHLLPADACALYLSVRNAGAEPLAFGLHGVGPLEGLTLIGARGRARRVGFEGQVVKGRARKFWGHPRLEPGRTMEVVVAPEPEEEVLRAAGLPLLLRGTHSRPFPHGLPIFFRLPEPSPPPGRPVRKQAR